MNSESFVISGKLPVIYCLAWIHFDISLTEMLIMIASRGAVLHVSDSTHIGLVLLKEMHTILNFVTNNFLKNIAQIAWVQPDIERYEFCSWNWQLSPVFTNNNAFHYFAIWSVTVFVALTYNTSSSWHIIVSSHERHGVPNHWHIDCLFNGLLYV